MTEELRAELKKLEDKWNADMLTKDRAGGNSKDNQRMVEIRAILNG